MRVDLRTLEIQRAETVAKAEQARAANDNRTAHVMEFEAARLDRDPEPKIGHIAMALERRGERTARGDFWREVVDRNLKRFRDWLALQRARLDALWGIGRALSRAQQASDDIEDAIQSRDERDGQTSRGGEVRYTQEQHDWLLGRNRVGQDPLRQSRDSTKGGRTSRRDNDREW